MRFVVRNTVFGIRRTSNLEPRSYYDPGHGSLPQRDEDAGADGRTGDAVRDGVGQRTEPGDRHGDVNRAHEGILFTAADG
jgi:hypothetical protein